jgi:alpha-mannosidase
MQTPTTFAYIPSSHLDLYWLGNYKTCLERGAEVIKQYVDRCLATPDETFFLETVVFATYFLQKYPHYREDLIRLVREGRLEIGSAYVDRWETLIPGESLIRNIQLGKRWYQSVFGADNLTVTHPDLPSMIPQIAQLYSQLGLRYYVTSRKVYRHGQVWRQRSPDGSRLLVLNWPRHYVFALISAKDATVETLKRIWIPPLELAETLKGFPLGTVAISGSAGDLAGRETFVERYGQNLEDYVQEFRVRYPDFRFGYTTPSRVLSPYQNVTDLPEHAGQIPSVWGVACDEEATFFQRDRAIENQLLSAETLAVIAKSLGFPWLPENATEAQGTFYEQAFFARKDPIPAQDALTELWRMHIFTQDHNGGGQEGALSTFQKRVIQQRLLQYTSEVHDCVLRQIITRLKRAGSALICFNPLGQAWQGPLAISLPANKWHDSTGIVDSSGASLATQVITQSEETVQLYVDLPAVPAVGYRTFTLSDSAPSDGTARSGVKITRSPGTLTLETTTLAVAIDLAAGHINQISDRVRGQDWTGMQAGSLYALKESGNDVTLRIQPDTPRLRTDLISVEVLDSGPLFTRVLLRKQLLKSTVEQTLTLWHNQARLDLETVIYWHGQHNQQIRMILPSAPTQQISHGSPFYGVGWDEIVEGTSPYNNDEIAPSDQMAYREVHDWLHLRGDQAGLTLVTDHPGFHHQDEQLAAVLLRTPPSCGDSRLFFENAGRQVFTFSLLPGATDWRSAQAPRVAQMLHRAPIFTCADAPGGGSLPDIFSFLSIDGAGIALSSIYPSTDTSSQPGNADILLRLWDTTGQGGKVTLGGPLAEAGAKMADLMDTPTTELSGQPGRWQLDVPAYAIRTVRLLRPI